MKPEQFSCPAVVASATFAKDVMPLAFERILREEQPLVAGQSDHDHPIYASIVCCITSAWALINVMLQAPEVMTGHLQEATAAFLRAAGNVIDTDSLLASHEIASSCKWCKEPEDIFVETFSGLQLHPMQKGYGPEASQLPLISLPWVLGFLCIMDSNLLLENAYKVRTTAVCMYIKCAL